MSGDDHDAVEKAFHEAVDTAPAELERWLRTDERRSVGMERDVEDTRCRSSRANRRHGSSK